MTSPMNTRAWPPVLRWSLIIFFLLCILVSARQVAFYWSRGPVVSDLRIFMTGVEMLRTGEGHRLYQFEAQQAVQNRLYPATRQAGLLPFNHLAYELLLYWPLARLPYRTALVTWALFNLALVFLIGWLLTPLVATLRSRTGVPVALWLLAFYPVLYVFGEGQDSLVSLLFVVLSLRCAIARRMFLAGCVLGLGLFKFHLALLIAFYVFALPRNWRALAGFATTAATVTGISRLLVGPAFASDYLHMLRNQDVMTPWGFVPRFMPNVRGVLQWGLEPRLDIGTIQPIVVLASLLVAGAAILRVLRSPTYAPVALYTIGVLTTLLVSYHLHMQDLSLAALPMLLLLEASMIDTGLRLWTSGVALAMACLYLYRIACEPVPILLVRGCLLAIPIFSLWALSLENRPSQNACNA